MLRYFDEFFSDPKGMLVFFLLAFPGRILALSVHEFAHAWVANRCGDPTAKQLGRLTINPLKHLDVMGTLLMLLVGFGWAKPVPVNPRNYRNARWDDLKVSVAGVGMNLLMFCLSMVLMIVAAGFALSRIPVDKLTFDATVIRMNYFGVESLVYPIENTYVPIEQLMANLPYAGEYLITPVFGTVAGYLYQMLGYFAVTNLVLCVFNLLPVPPLDGYHVLNDLALRRTQLFASPQTARIASTVLFALCFTGAVGKMLGWVDEQVLTAAGKAAMAALRAMNLIT